MRLPGPFARLCRRHAGRPPYGVVAHGDGMDSPTSWRCRSPLAEAAVAGGVRRPNVLRGRIDAGKWALQCADQSSGELCIQQGRRQSNGDAHVDRRSRYGGRCDPRQRNAVADAAAGAALGAVRIDGPGRQSLLHGIHPPSAPSKAKNCPAWCVLSFVRSEGRPGLPYRTKRVFVERSASWVRGGNRTAPLYCVDGRVLVAGGFDGGTHATAKAEVYLPSNDTFGSHIR